MFIATANWRHLSLFSVLTLDSHLYPLISVLIFAIFAGAVSIWFLIQGFFEYAFILILLFAGPICAVTFWFGHYLNKGNYSLITDKLSSWRPSILFWITGFSFAIFTGLVASHLSLNLPGILICSLLAGLANGLSFSSLFVFDYKVQTEDSFNFTISKLLNWRFWLKVSVLFLILGLVISILSSGLGIYNKDNPEMHIFNGLWCAIAATLIIIFEKIKNVKEFSAIENPYQRFFGGLVVNLLFAIIMILVFGSSLVFLNYDSDYFENTILFPMIALIIFTLSSIQRNPLFQHPMLRISLYLEGSVPAKYVTFLNHCAEARILEKDGGHWRFRHQNLQEYFANSDERTTQIS